MLFFDRLGKGVSSISLRIPWGYWGAWSLARKLSFVSNFGENWDTTTANTITIVQCHAHSNFKAHHNSRRIVTIDVWKHAKFGIQSQTYCFLPFVECRRTSILVRPFDRYSRSSVIRNWKLYWKRSVEQDAVAHLCLLSGALFWSHSPCSLRSSLKSSVIRRPLRVLALSGRRTSVVCS